MMVAKLFNSLVRGSVSEPEQGRKTCQYLAKNSRRIVMTVKVKSDYELLVFDNISGIVSSKVGGGDHIEQVNKFVDGLDIDAAQLSAREWNN